MLNPSVQHTPAPRRILPLIVAGFVVGVVGVGASSSCVVCASDDDCDAGEVCLTGAGCAPTQPPTLRVRPPSDADIVDGWPLTIELGFRGVDAVVEVERSSDNPGDPCVPFGVVRRVVPGTVDTFTTHELVVDDLPSLGPDFTLRVRATVAGESIFASTTLHGPPLDDTWRGITLEQPQGGDVDVIDDPLIPVLVVAESARNIAVFVEASSATWRSQAGNSTPRQFLPDGRGEVPALRGPHIVWAEASINGQARRCGRAMQGGPNDLANHALEIYLLTKSQTGTDEHLIELSTRVASDVGVAICDGRAPSASACRQRVSPPAPGPQGRDSLQIDLRDGVVEIAVVPHIISGPVDAIVRLSRGDTHLAMFGPITLRPELGEVWLAGRVVVHEDAVAAVVAGTEPPAIGLPW
jgi:hypothetical protein